MIKYKGYTGKVEFDNETELLQGEVVGLNDVITFQGESVKEIKQAFIDSVEDYLAFCVEMDKQPEKPFGLVKYDKKKSELSELFVDTVIKRAYKGAINDVLSKLEKESKLKKPPKQLIELQNWYRNLKDTDRSYIEEIIRDSVEASVFGFFVVLDGAYMGDSNQKLAEWAIYHQSYKDQDNLRTSMPMETTRLNMVRGVEELHDIFLHKLGESSLI